MMNKFFLLAVIFAACLGCGLINRAEKAVSGSDSNSANSNKTLTDKAVDTAVGESKIGIPECDEVMDLIQNELDNSDDNFIVKAGKATVLNRIKDGIKEGVEKNKNSNSNKDAEEMAKTCREFRKQFDKYKAEENAKHSQ